MSGIEALDILAEQFARLPGIGRKTAERLAFAVLEYSPEDVNAFTRAMTEAKAKEFTQKLNNCKSYRLL